MKQNINTPMDQEHYFNNANEVVKNLEAKAQSFDGKFFTMVQGNSFGGVTISNSNIQNNSQFITDLWD